MDIKGKIKVFAKVNEIDGSISYRTYITSKSLDGKTLYHYMFLNLVGEAKNKPIDDNSFIDVKNGFLSFNRTSKDGNAKDTLKVVISDFDYCEDKQSTNSTDDNLDLPF